MKKLVKLAAGVPVLADVRGQGTRRDALDHRRPPRKPMREWWNSCWFKTKVVDVWNRWPAPLEPRPPSELVKSAYDTAVAGLGYVERVLLWWERLWEPIPTEW